MVTAFHEIYRKQMDADPLTPGIQTVPVSFVDPELPPMVDYPVTGFGFSHAGNINSLHHFVEQLEGAVNPNTPQITADLTDFAWQWDQGMGRATNAAYLLNQATQATVGPELSTYLEPQAIARNCGIAVYGTVNFGEGARHLAWYYDRDDQVFVCDDTSVPDQPLSFFLAQAQSDTGSNVFIGTPVGSARRFAVDYDGDDLHNFEETQTWGSDVYLVDSDGDDFWDGVEAQHGGNPTFNGIPFPDDQTDPGIDDASTQWFTTKIASLVVHADEPSTVTVDYSTPGQPASQLVLDDPKMVHRILLGDLLGGGGGVTFTYDGTITVTDRAGNSSSVPLPDAPPIFGVFGPPPITTRPLSGGNFAIVVEDLEFTNLLFSATPSGIFGVQATARIQLRRKVGGPPFAAVPDVRAVFRVLKDKQPTSFSAPGADFFKLNGTPYTEANFPGALEGPFLISQSDTNANGVVTVTFTASGFQAGETLTLNVEAFGATTATHTNADPDLVNINRWSMPDTPSENRCLTLQF